MNKLTNIKHYRKEHVKALYAKFGKSSGLNPGVLWPRKEELHHLKEYEKAFCPSLDHLLAENKAKKDAAARALKAREEEVSANLKKLPNEFKLFFDEIKEKKREQDEWLKKKEATIEEVRELLGFRAKPTDERFQKALAMKEEEERKAKKKEARLQMAKNILGD